MPFGGTPLANVAGGGFTAPALGNEELELIQEHLTRGQGASPQLQVGQARRIHRLPGVNVTEGGASMSIPHELPTFDVPTGGAPTGYQLKVGQAFPLPQRLTTPPVKLPILQADGPIELQRAASQAIADRHKKRVQTSTSAGDGVSVKDARRNNIKKAMLKKISGIKDEEERMEAFNMMLEMMGD